LNSCHDKPANEKSPGKLQGRISLP
jgi:hypothetical protein